MRVTKGKPPSQLERARDQLQQQTRAMNEQLVLSGVRQHELAEAASSANAQLRAEITERKRAEETVRQSAALFSQLVDQAPGGVYVVDDQFRVQQVNARALPAFGNVRPLIGRDFSEVIQFVWGHKVGSQIADIFRHTLETGERYVSPEFTESREDIGVEQSYEWEIQRVTLPDGKHGVVCYFTDITERKQAELAVALLAAIVDSSHDAIISRSLDGIITSWNAGAERLFGYTAQEAMGQSVNMLIPAGRLDEEPRIVERIRRAEGIQHYETVRRHKDGTLFNISLTASPIKNAKGQVIGASKIARDITERKRAEEALRQAQTQLADRAVQLEGMVAERTSKLTAAHKQLLADIIERKRLEGEIAKAVEAEQLRLGGELHDGLAQEVTGATMILYTLEKQMAEASPAYAQKLHEVQQMLLKTVTQARNLASGFYPVELEKHGLGVALQQLAQRTQESFGVSCVVEADHQPPKESKAATAIQLFRVAQEAVHNATKHSRAAGALCGGHQAAAPEHLERTTKPLPGLSQCRFPPPQFHGAPVDILNGPRGIAEIDGHRSRFEQGAKAFFAHTQGILSLLAGGNVHEREPAPFPHPFEHDCACRPQAGPNRPAAFLQHLRPTDLVLAPGKYSFQEGQKDRPIRRGDKKRQEPVDQSRPFHAKKRGARQVRLQDQA
jgi:PAS domain S-box-containing protein